MFAALCDDDKYIIEELKKLLLTYAKENRIIIDIDEFESGEKLANVPADNLEICVLFNNMIDIAFENVKEFCGNGKQIIALKAETRAGFLFCCISFPIENEIKKAQNNVLYHSFAYKTLKNLAEKNGGKIETSLSDDRLAITTGWVINNFS